MENLKKYFLMVVLNFIIFYIVGSTLFDALFCAFTIFFICTAKNKKHIILFSIIGAVIFAIITFIEMKYIVSPFTFFFFESYQKMVIVAICYFICCIFFADANFLNMEKLSIFIIASLSFVFIETSSVIICNGSFYTKQNSFLSVGLIIVLMVSFFFSLFLKPTIAALISSDIFFFLSIVDYVVFCFTTHHFSFQDLSAASAAFDVLEKYSLNKKQILSIIIIVLFFIIYNFLIIKFVNKGNIKKKFLVFAFISSFILSVTIITSSSNLEFRMYDKDGFVYSLCYSLNPSLHKPDDFEQYKDYEIKKTENTVLQKKPNVVVVMSEAFSDLTIDDISFQNDYMPFTRKIMDESISGYFYSSVFGNNTTSTEFEFLTGIPTLFTAKGAFVYQHKLNDSYVTIPKILKDYGYETFGMHPEDKLNYNRYEAWPALGIDNTYFIEDFENPTEIKNNISDKDVFDKTKTIIENTDNPAFIFDLTMQNHSPYDFEISEENIFGNSLNNDEISTYAYFVNKSDESLRNFIEYCKNSNEEILIVFFGDHQPSINEISSTIDDSKRFLVPYFIWANYDLEKCKMDTISINYLGAEFLKVLDINNDWFNFILENEKSFPVISDSIQIVNGNTLESPNELFDNFADDKLLAYRALSYKFVTNK